MPFPWLNRKENDLDEATMVRFGFQPRGDGSYIAVRYPCINCSVQHIDCVVPEPLRSLAEYRHLWDRPACIACTRDRSSRRCSMGTRQTLWLWTSTDGSTLTQVPKPKLLVQRKSHCREMPPDVMEQFGFHALSGGQYRAERAPCDGCGTKYRCVVNRALRSTPKAPGVWACVSCNHCKAKLRPCSLSTHGSGFLWTTRDGLSLERIPVSELPSSPSREARILSSPTASTSMSPPKKSSTKKSPSEVSSTKEPPSQKPSTNPTDADRREGRVIWLTAAETSAHTQARPAKRQKTDPPPSPTTSSPQATHGETTDQASRNVATVDFDDLLDSSSPETADMPSRVTPEPSSHKRLGRSDHSSKPSQPFPTPPRTLSPAVHRPRIVLSPDSDEDELTVPPTRSQVGAASSHAVLRPPASPQPIPQQTSSSAQSLVAPLILPSSSSTQLLAPPPRLHPPPSSPVEAPTVTSSDGRPVTSSSISNGDPLIHLSNDVHDAYASLQRSRRALDLAEAAVKHDETTYKAACATLHNARVLLGHARTLPG